MKHFTYPSLKTNNINEHNASSSASYLQLWTFPLSKGNRSQFHTIVRSMLKQYRLPVQDSQHVSHCSVNQIPLLFGVWSLPTSLSRLPPFPVSPHRDYCKQNIAKDPSLHIVGPIVIVLIIQKQWTCNDSIFIVQRALFNVQRCTRDTTSSSRSKTFTGPVPLHNLNAPSMLVDWRK